MAANYSDRLSDLQWLVSERQRCPNFTSERISPGRFVQQGQREGRGVTFKTPLDENTTNTMKTPLDENTTNTMKTPLVTTQYYLITYQPIKNNNNEKWMNNEKMLINTLKHVGGFAPHTPK